MLITILAMAVAVSLEPFRVGMTMLMLNRPRPLPQLLAFLSGGFAMGMTVGLAVLFVFRRMLVGSTYFTLPRVQMLLGLFALLVAAVLAVRVATGRSGACRLPARTHRLLHGPSLWVAGVAGLGIGLPSVDYLAALAVILASGAAAEKQVCALLMFNAVAFAFVEIPVLAYLLTPRATRTSVAALHCWIRSRRRLEVAAVLTIVGGVLLLAGLTGH